MIKSWLNNKLGVEETRMIVLLKYLFHYYVGGLIGTTKRLIRILTKKLNYAIRQSITVIRR